MMGDVEGDAGEGPNTTAQPPDGEGGFDNRADGLDHLRAAAGELIQACRAVLDVAEDLLDDPATASAVADGFGALLRGAADLGRRAAGAASPAAQPAGDHDDDGAAAGDATDRHDGPSRVQRIRVV